MCDTGVSILLSGLALTLHGRTVVDVRITVMAGAGAALLIALPDGHGKRIDVPVGRYSAIRKEGEIEVSVEKGFFGVPVIKGIEFPVYRYERF